MYLAESELLTSLTFRSTVQESLNDLWASGVQWGYMGEVICPQKNLFTDTPVLWSSPSSLWGP